MSNITLSQAVILAGGRGTRLKPLTDTMPKPMVIFHGKPFLEYLINNLYEQGISKIVLLLGYLPAVIKDYFGNGDRFGVHIDYSITDVDNNTGRRMKLAEPFMDDYFLFMYCDNYWPLRLNEMLDEYNKMGVDGQLTIYSNKDNYTKDNVIIDQQRLIQKYDNSRTGPNLKGVDIGYAIFKKSVLDFLSKDNILFESTVYPHLTDANQLSGYITDHRYYSVGSFERLEKTEKFLERGPTIILDRDGVLNKKAPKAEYIAQWSEFEWLPGAKEALALLKQSNYRIIIITNQAGINRGLMTNADLMDIHEKMKREATEAGGDIDAIYYCPHGWDENCDCRKPKPGMFFQAQHDFHLDLTRTYFVGDDERDEMAGKAAGCPTILVSDNYPLLSAVKEKIINE